MDRRTWLTTVGAGTLALPHARAAAAEPAWRFVLDAARRWGLTDGRTTAVRGAGLAFLFAGRPAVPFAAFEVVRELRGGDGAQRTRTFITRLDDVEAGVTFADGARPRILVRVRGLETAHDLVAVRFTDDLPVPQARVWMNGYQSWSATRTVEPAAGRSATGHWQAALWEGRATALALGFGTDDDAAGEFLLAGRTLTAVAQFRRRAISAVHPPATATLTIVPGGDPFAHLAALAAAGAPPARALVPAGWSSWHGPHADVTEEQVLANVEEARRRFDPRYFRLVQLDDGFQRAAGDWEMNAKFPHGHRWLTDRIHGAGFDAGLWLAPFAVTAASGVPERNPEWLVRGPDGLPLPLDDQPHWGGRTFALDASQRAVQDWLRALTRRAVTEWGYDHLRLDVLHYGAQGTRPERGASPHEALRAGLRALREGAGRAYVLGCGAPLQHSVGMVDGMRIGPDVSATWGGVQPAAQATLLRAHFHRNPWQNDPGAVVVRPPLTREEARTWAALCALSGGLTLFSDHLPRLTDDRFDILRRTIPVAPVAGRAADRDEPEAVLAPGLVAGERRLAALEGWRLRPGDDPRWSAPLLDETEWTPIEVGVPWERAGHPDLDGFAWYRARFTVGAPAPAGPLHLALGAVDDADETFLNGVRIGGTGSMPPSHHEDRLAFRRYPVAAELVRWGSENVVAVRVHDGGGGGGLWRLTRARPPSWVVARAPRGWWTVLVVNWDDEDRRFTRSLPELGLAGPLAVYDVWADERGADVPARLVLDIPARSSALLGLRRPRLAPFVLGTTRHLVQGAVDVADERWEARRRALRGRAVNLDGRPHAITIAVPRGWHPTSCAADVPCTVRHVHRLATAVRLELEGTREDVSWEVGF
jgi:alpha-galactosidase